MWYTALLMWSDLEGHSHGKSATAKAQLLEQVYINNQRHAVL
jgi:hypothetical protein